MSPPPPPPSSSSSSSLSGAVQALYHGDEHSRRLADSWLLEFQSSSEAWEACAVALSQNASSSDAAGGGGGGGQNGTTQEVQFIAAQTLATKVRRDFDEIPATSVSGLRETLLSNLLRFTAETGIMSPVCPQLCIAVAAMAGHMDAMGWDGSVVEWLKRRLQQEQPGIAVPVMMQLLSVLPEEAETRRHLRPERRRQFIAELAACVPTALELLCSCLESEKDNVRNQSLALTAYAAWLRLGSTASGELQVAGGNDAGHAPPPTEAIVNCATLAQHPLTASALRALQSEDNFDAAVDVAAELIRRTAPADVCGEPSAVQTALVQLIVPHVMGMRALFQRASSPNADIDDAIVKGMARLFAEIGEAYVGMISAGTADVMEPVEVLLEVAAYEDFEIAEMSFRFWDRLSNLLAPGRRDHGSVSTSISTDERQRRRILFAPVFERLVTTVMRRVRYPENCDAMTRDEKAEFYFMRGCIADCLRDGASVLGGEAVLKIVSTPLQEVAEAVARGAAFDWMAVEAAMFCMYSISHLARCSDSVILPQIFASLANVPRQPKLVLMVANNIGAYSEWFAVHDGSSGGLLPPLLTLLGEALAMEDTARAASYALKMVCMCCAEQLSASFIDPLLQICQQSVAIGLTQPSNGAVSGVDEDCVIFLLEGVAAVIARLPPDRLIAAVRTIAEPLLESMKSVLSRSPHLDENDWHMLICIADRLAPLLRGVENHDASASTFRLFWPYVNAALGVPHISFQAAERLCRLCNFVLMSSGNHTADLLQQLVPVVQQRFAEQRYCCYIYSTSQMVKFFGSHELYMKPLASLVHSLLVETVRGIQTPEAFNMDSEMVDDSFILAGRCLRYSPKILLASDLLGPMLDWGILGMHVQHKDACLSILDFFQKLIKAARPDSSISAEVLAVLPSRGPVLMRKLLAAIAGAVPYSHLMSVSDTLILLLHVGGTTAFCWMQEALQQLPVVVAQPEDLKNLLEVSRIEAERPDGGEDRYFDLVDEFSFLCTRNKRSIESARSSLMRGIV